MRLKSRRFLKIYLLAVIIGSFLNVLEATEVVAPSSITLRVLDKTKNRNALLKTSLTTPVRYGRLIVRPRACVKKKIGAGYTVNFAFVEAWVESIHPQIGADGNLLPPPLELVFSGWINSMAPHFSHPDYALTVTDCNVITPQSIGAKSEPDHQ